nr:hypothetical protein [Tanacetum cinerariifolium]
MSRFRTFFQRYRQYILSDGLIVLCPTRYGPARRRAGAAGLPRKKATFQESARAAVAARVGAGLRPR